MMFKSNIFLCCRRRGKHIRRGSVEPNSRREPKGGGDVRQTRRRFHEAAWHRRAYYQHQ